MGCCFIKSQMCPHMWTSIIPIFKVHSVQNVKYWVCEPESRLWFSSKTSIPLVRRNTQILYNRKGIAAHRHIISKIKQRDHPFLLCMDCCSIIHGLLSPSLRLWQNRPAPEPAVLFLARWGRYEWRWAIRKSPFNVNSPIWHPRDFFSHLFQLLCLLRLKNRGYLMKNKSIKEQNCLKTCVSIKHWSSSSRKALCYRTQNSVFMQF